MNENTQGLIDIGNMILDFAKVNRVTLHQDGSTLESDTDHTVMLAVAACSVASKLYPHLDVGLIAQFATVHDLVEVYAGDTNTFNLEDGARKEKERREKESFAKIKDIFSDRFPWIHTTIAKYETLDTQEARFVKTLDKAMTKITNILNNGAYFRVHTIPKEEMEKHYTAQLSLYKNGAGKEFPELMYCIEELTQRMVAVTYK